MNKAEVSLANVNILPPYTAWQRVCNIVSSVPLTDLMVNLFTVGYKKVRDRKMLNVINISV